MPEHFCCFRARLIIITERHHSVVLPRPKTSKQCLFLPLIKSAYGFLRGHDAVEVKLKIKVTSICIARLRERI